jgi:hypothetical protein
LYIHVYGKLFSRKAIEVFIIFEQEIKIKFKTDLKYANKAEAFVSILITVLELQELYFTL